MDRRDHIDAFGASSLIAVALLMAFNQVVIKVVNEGLQPVFLPGSGQSARQSSSGAGFTCAVAG